MLAHINIRHLVFIDIETVPQFSSFAQLSPAMQQLWAAKHMHLHIENETPEESYLKRAGVYSEFAKIICISLGFFHFSPNGIRQFRVKSFFGDNEKELLLGFSALIKKSFNDPDHYNFCGHNIREFDIPFICRRLLINHLTFPSLFDISGKRPWEISDIDTLQLWRFGDFKNYTSLKLLAEVLGIPTPKADIEGKDVCRVYWVENGLPRIVEYCQKDVITVARLLLRFKGEEQPLTDEEIFCSP
jgi:DNA polymerase elongation subunit (family B)